MKALYVTSIEHYIGKTGMCLALGKHMQNDHYKVGYLKPVSTQPWRTPEGELADEDASFVRKVLNLEAPLAELVPVIVTPTFLRERLKAAEPPDLIDQVQRAAEKAGRDKDVLLIEGGSSMREGYSIGMSNLQLADRLGAASLVLIRYRREMQLVDDALAARARLGDRLIGVIYNQVADDARGFLDEVARPYLTAQGVPVLGALPSIPILSALSVGELITILKPEILTASFDPDALCERFTIGAMNVDAALSRFRRQKNKAVITGGDRSDIMLAALETSTRVLILTGNLRPSPLILKQAEALQVPVLLVQENTMETMNQIERAYGKTPLGAPEKLEAFIELTRQHVDKAAIYQALGLG
jgi:BioD-like phosphotransacetylase family protein